MWVCIGLPIWDPHELYGLPVCGFALVLPICVRYCDIGFMWATYLSGCIGFAHVCLTWGLCGLPICELALSLPIYEHGHTCAGVKIISKNGQGSFGPFMSHFWEASQSLKGPKFCFFVNKANNDITVASKYAGPADPPGIIFKGPLARGPASCLCVSNIGFMWATHMWVCFGFAHVCPTWALCGLTIYGFALVFPSVFNIGFMWASHSWVCIGFSHACLTWGFCGLPIYEDL